MTADLKDRDLFIADNGAAGRFGLRHLAELAGIAKAFEIEALLAPAGKVGKQHIKNPYLERTDARVGIKPALRCWIGLCE